MAVDQAILESVNDDPDSKPTLRIYRWSPATLSLGYFQAFDDRQNHAASLECDVVRRASGGGAILHDKEITYSLIVPSANRLASANEALYQSVHNAIIAVLQSEYSIDSHLYSQPQSVSHQTKPTTETPCFLCFQRRTNGDIVFDNHKIVGSAQRRHKRAILQHGSILLEASKYAPELPGIFDIADVQFDADKFVEQFTAALCGRLNFVPHWLPMTTSEMALAEHIEVRKFADDDWTIRRRRG